MKILLLEDSPDDVMLIERELEKSGILFSAEVVTHKQGFEQGLRNFQPDVILCDHSLPTFNAIEAFQLYTARREETGQSIPFILVTGNTSEEFGVQSIKVGMDDYILKDRLKRLPLAIESAIQKCRMENDRLRYMRQVIASEALMNEAEELANFGSWQVDARTKKHTWSAAVFSLYGLNPAEADPSFELFFSHVHPEDRPSLQEKIQLFLTIGGGECEFRIVTKAGEVKYISCKMRVKYDANGAPLSFIGFNLDITERREAALALERKEQTYRSLFEQNPNAVFSLDREGIFTNVNREAVTLTGRSEQELIGKHYTQVIRSYDQTRAAAYFLSTLQGKSNHWEDGFVCDDKEAVRLDVTTIPILVHDVVDGMHCVVRKLK